MNITSHWFADLDDPLVLTVIRRMLTYTGTTVADVDNVPYRFRRILTYTGNNCCSCGRFVSIEMSINLPGTTFADMDDS
jgi:hypothetical protein